MQKLEELVGYYHTQGSYYYFDHLSLTCKRLESFVEDSYRGELVKLGKEYCDKAEHIKKTMTESDEKPNQYIQKLTTDEMRELIQEIYNGFEDHLLDHIKSNLVYDNVDTIEYFLTMQERFNVVMNISNLGRYKFDLENAYNNKIDSLKKMRFE